MGMVLRLSSDRPDQRGAPLGGRPPIAGLAYFFSARLVTSVWYSTDITPVGNERRVE